MVKQLLLVLCILLTITACDKSSNKQRSRIDPTKPAKVQLMQHGQVTPVVLQPVNNAPQHTGYVGTTDQPTIDGGIINAADGLPVIFFAENTESKDRSNNDARNNQKNLLANNTNKIQEQKTVTKTQNNFSGSLRDNQDTWATSTRVKTLLRQAAKDGKLEYVLNKSDEKGLPASVAIVPMIESRYQDNATSPKGAAGVWQLMTSTAKDYGVKKEDRYKFQPSTEAALNLLNDLHKQFGNWELAFAAYNAGAERVQTALQNNPHAKSVQELNLPKETKNYVSRIMALNKTMESL